MILKKNIRQKLMKSFPVGKVLRIKISLAGQFVLFHITIYIVLYNLLLSFDFNFCYLFAFSHVFHSFVSVDSYHFSQRIGFIGFSILNFI